MKRQRQSVASGVIHPRFPKVIETEKVLLALQFWKGDQEQAMRVARFMADLQTGHSDQADFLFVSRFDCRQDSATVKYVSQKFNTHTFTSRRRGRGWPHGCNDLWFATMTHLCESIEMRRLPAYKFIFTFEADNVPISSGWLQYFIRQWDAQQKKKRTFVMGAEVMYPERHINGNALFSTSFAFLRWLARDICASPSNAGWDFYLAKAFRDWGAANLPGLQSLWGTKSLSEEGIQALFSSEAVWIHGVKDDSLLQAAHKRLLG